MSLLNVVILIIPHGVTAKNTNIEENFIAQRTCRIPSQTAYATYLSAEVFTVNI
jgi:hypothetical protein